MSFFAIYHWVTFSVLTLALLVGLVLGFRALAKGQVAAWLCVIGCVVLLWEHLSTLAIHASGLYTVRDLVQINQRIVFFSRPWGMLALTAAAVCGACTLSENKRPGSVDEKAGDASGKANQQPWSRGKHLLVAALISLMLVPICAVLVLGMFKARRLFVPTAFVGVLAVPSVVVWLLTSRYLEALRVETTPSGQWPVTLWAYAIASVSALAAIFFALFAFILLGLQQGWIQQ